MKRYFTLLATTAVVASLATASAFAAQQNQDNYSGSNKNNSSNYSGQNSGNTGSSNNSYNNNTNVNNNNSNSNSKVTNVNSSNNNNNNTKPQNAEWSYTGKNGPENWGKISKQYSLCESGSNQSPINISDFKQTNLPKIEVNYKQSPLNISNNGHTVQVNYNSGSNVTIGGKQYNLQQVHFHTPSEHTVQGKNSPLEVHFVHQDQQGKLGVIAVMVEQGKENKELQNIWNNIPKTPGQNVAFNNVKINAEQLLPQNKQYFTYTGSLTTPPCSEQVSWYVLKQPVQASKQQIQSFKNVYQYNARPQQPLKGRQIQGS